MITKVLGENAIEILNVNESHCNVFCILADKNTFKQLKMKKYVFCLLHYFSQMSEWRSQLSNKAMEMICSDLVEENASDSLNNSTKRAEFQVNK